MHLITGLSSGGAERMLTRLVTHGASANGDVHHTVISMMDEGFFGDKIKRAGVPLITLGMERSRPSLGGLLRLIKVLKQEKPDVLQTWLYHADLMGSIAARFAGGARVAWNLRCSDMDMQRYSRLSKAVLWLLAWLSATVDAIAVNSRAGRRVHEDLGYRPPRWDLIPNGFDLNDFRPDEGRRRAFRAEILAADDQLVVAMVARLDPMKDHTTFLDAARNIAGAVPGVVFVVVGEGCEDSGVLAREVAVRGLEGCVRLLGRRTDVANILPGFDVSVLSSAFGEGFPNVIGEAMASGVPVVATDVGDSRVIVGDTGEVVAPRNAQALAMAIVHMAKMSRDERAQLGHMARARIVQNYALDTVIAHYENFYRDLAKG